MAIAPGSLRYVVVQPTPFCNIDCGYCYLGNRSAKDRMSFETLERVFDQILTSVWANPNIQVIWHAGEPLTLPRTYYDRAFEIISRLAGDRIKVGHGFNSNGTLIDDDWCDFFLRHDAAIGLSIDGPAQIHDRNRLTRSGRGTFDQAARGLRLLKQRGVPFYVISVLTLQSLGMADELYDFYKAEGVPRVCFNVEEIEGVHRRSTLEADEAQLEFERFLRRFWNRMLEDRGGIWVREFDHMIKEIMKNPEAPVVRTLSDPFVHLSVDWQGNFSTFSPELLGQASEAFGNFVLGNLTSGSLADAAETPLFRRLDDEIRRGVTNCRQSCEYFDVCGGGAPTNKFWETGSFTATETMFCRLMKKAVANVALDIIDGLVADGVDPSQDAPSVDEPVIQQFA